MAALGRDIIDAARPHAAQLKVGLAELLAIVEVESGGVVYATVGGKQQPLIRWEGHYFDRRLTGEKLAKARAEGLAHPQAGKIKNPNSQAGRWSLLKRAILIDAQAALESCSWGVGQVMGAHWKTLGFGSVSDLVNLARSGAGGQIELMARFIQQTGLDRSLRSRNWAAFARGYNGPAYKKYGYDRQMARAYERYSALAGGGNGRVAGGMLKLGARGERVRELQQLLQRAGHNVAMDGDFGPATERALRAYQASAGLADDGAAGPQTMRSLDRYRQGPDDAPGVLKLAEIPAVREGFGIGGGGGVSLEIASMKLEQVSAQAGYLPGLEWLSIILSLLAAALVIGGLGWAVWGWWTARDTVSGDEADAVGEPVE